MTFSLTTPVSASETDRSGDSPGYYEPSDYYNKNYVTLFEVKGSLTKEEYKAKVPTAKFASSRVIADVTVFASEDDLKAGLPSKKFTSAWVKGGPLGKDLLTALGGAIAGRITKIEGKDGNRDFAVLRPVDKEILDQLVVYAEGRTAPATETDQEEEPPF